MRRLKIAVGGTSSWNKANTTEPKVSGVQNKKPIAQPTVKADLGSTTGKIITTEKRDKNKVISTALAEIKKRECGGWPHLTAYPDWWWYTIGCWTRSYRWEKITAEVAYSRLASIVNSLYTRLNDKYSRMTNNQLSATISLGFNCNSCLAGIKERISKDKWLSWSYGRLPWWRRVYMEWLYRRRVSERNLFNK